MAAKRTKTPTISSSDRTAAYALAVVAGGIQLASNGMTSAFDVVADMFRVSSPSGGQRTEYSDGNWRTYYPNGQLATRMGWWQ